MSELEQNLILALEKEDIHIEHLPDGEYRAIWPSRYSHVDSATGHHILLDSSTSASFITVVLGAINAQKHNEYWRGKKDALDQAIRSLQSIASETFKESVFHESEGEPKQGE